MKKGVIPEAFFSSQIDRLKDPEDFILIQKSDEGFAEALLWKVDDPFSHLPMFRVHEPDHFCEGLQGSEAQIAGSGKVFSLILEMIEESDE
jgi:hypothetical protein